MGAVAVIVLVLFALMWVTVRAAVALRLVLDDDERPAPKAPCVQDRPTPQDAVDGPQDAPAVVEAPATGPTPLTSDLMLSIAAAVWWNTTRALADRAAHHRGGADPAVPASSSSGASGATRAPGASGHTAAGGAPEAEWGAVFRASVLDAVRRPEGGPEYLGGRDDAAYLSGWDAAVDWIGQGQDATPPTWGDLAYMTGWYDGLRDVARARRRSGRLASA